jgi:hypothetical protein
MASSVKNSEVSENAPEETSASTDYTNVEYKDQGEVLGEEALQTSKLNFYTVLGFFGLLVGSFGLVVAFHYTPAP